jgi:murein DD-endopeptidase MepM/ murein hydrolase activator NlpD
MVKGGIENILKFFFAIAVMLGLYFLNTISAGSLSPAPLKINSHDNAPVAHYRDESTDEWYNEYPFIDNNIMPGFISSIVKSRDNDGDKETYENFYSLPVILPVSGNVTISSGFGSRRDPFDHHWAFHNGIDIPLKAGTPVHATGGGYISDLGTDHLLGAYVIINHQYDYQSIYGHLSEISVQKDQRVESGEIIGYSGNTGRSTNPHLHYQINYKGQPVDPVRLKKELKNLRMVLRN